MNIEVTFVGVAFYLEMKGVFLMTQFKRIKIQLLRQKGKTLTLFALISLLSSLSAGALLTRQAIMNTDLALRAQLPAVATIHLDQDAVHEEERITGVMPSFVGQLTPTTIREIGELPYVRLFDYTAWGFNFFSEVLIRYFEPNLFLNVDQELVVVDDFESLSLQLPSHLEQFSLRGVHSPHVAMIETGVLELVDGRVFTADEVTHGLPVTLVSQGFLEANHLALGDILALEYRIYQEEEGLLDFSQENLLGTKPFELEIIGVFNHELRAADHWEFWEVVQHIRLMNEIYVPNLLIESVVELYQEAHPELLAETLAGGSLEDVIFYENILFLLNDPTELAAFEAAASHLLPDFWVVSDLSNAYAAIASSMEMIQGVVDYVFLGAIAATLVILTLVMLLFLRGRRQEIGIYLALGEKKISIIRRMMMEMLLIAVFAISMALLTGYQLGSVISREMIAQDLHRQAQQTNDEFNVTSDSLEGMGFVHEMTHEEMLDLYEVSLSGWVVLLFYSVTLGVVFISTAIPVWFIMQINPKEILTMYA